MRLFNSAQNHIDINLDAEIMDAQSGEDHDVSIQSSRLILEYVNLHISGIRRSKINSENRQEGECHTQGIWPHFPIHVCGHVCHQVHSYRNSDFGSQAPPP